MGVGSKRTALYMGCCWLGMGLTLSSLRSSHIRKGDMFEATNWGRVPLMFQLLGPVCWMLDISSRGASFDSCLLRSSLVEIEGADCVALRRSNTSVNCGTNRTLTQ